MASELKDITINDTGFLNLPSGTTAQRPGSPATGMMRYNTDLQAIEWYDGSNWVTGSYVSATGGTVVDSVINGVPYRTHYFLNRRGVTNKAMTLLWNDGGPNYASPNNPPELFNWPSSQQISGSDTSFFTWHGGHDGTFPHYGAVEVSDTPIPLNRFRWMKHANSCGNFDIYGSNAAITSGNYTDTNNWTHLGRFHAGGFGSAADGTILEFEFNDSNTAYKWYMIRVMDINTSPIAFDASPNFGTREGYAMYAATFDYVVEDEQFTVTKGGEVDYLLVGGGGAGGYDIGGGGGAGAVKQGKNTVTAGSYTITVGAAGRDSRESPFQDGLSGGSTTAFGLTAAGGGASGDPVSQNGSSGASGGGGRGNRGSNGGSATDGNSGADGPTNAGGGGGGGAGEAGQIGSTNNVGGRGGNGVSSTISGNVEYYGGGGAGGSWNVAGDPGRGGGGQPSRPSSGHGGDGAPHTGGGGAGGGSGNGGPFSRRNGGAGGTGVVIIRYKKDPLDTSTPDAVAYSNLPYDQGVIENGLSMDINANDPKTLKTPGVVTCSRNPLNNIGVYGSPQYLSEGKTNFWRFDGTNDIFYQRWIPVLHNLNDATIMLWYRSTQFHDTHSGPFAVHATGGSFVFMETRQGRNHIQAATETKSANRQASSSQIELLNGDWHHVAIARESDGNVYMYIDGNILSSSQLDVYGGWGSPGAQITIGGQADANGIYSYHACDIARFQLYNRRVPSAEIKHACLAEKWRYGA